ncbi:tyrosine-type recombinase/integrase [Emticicia sp. CRIBPO]|uniref:tyrosine-type recombinase/integrase n=1 Tax=Emticicia sp. CRIBPO TaxID=2683258 RepID=UPI0014132066|nr:tyrosine-type recombinase/integrase [Emticicia sp. CRIBPO]NBA84134.1 tyrosine-type recombinase/integrase [Emticicia sp. CRIBPO]
MTHLIERFTEILKKGKYNTMTISAYRNAIFVFYNHFRDLPQSKITDELIANYLVELSEKKGNKNDVIQAGKAIKLFYEVIFSRKLTIKASGELKKEKSPDILSQDEINVLFSSTKNLKHKVLLMLIYNSGLKISEVIQMKISDLDMKNHTLNIVDEETRQLRILRLAPNLIVFIDKYLQKYKPETILFPGANGKNYTARNIQLFFQKALNEAGIQKDATINTLRHSFAVHSLEMGLDIHLLQEILGHRFLQTTSFYNQLTKIKVEKLRSPLENITLEQD